MKAIIMAGGEGSRLRPLTCDCPKPMLPLMGIPMMEYAVRLLRRHGIDEIAATLGYLPEAIIDYFGDGRRQGVHMRFYTEKTPLGTAGSVLRAKDFLNERFIVLSGDGVTDFDLSAALRFHEERGCAATLLLKKCDHPQEYGMVVTDPDGRIRSFHEKPGRSDVYSNLINTGVYILEPELLRHIPEDRAFDFGHDLFPGLLKAGIPVYGYVAGGYWCDVGDAGAYLQVHFDALSGKINLPGLQSKQILPPRCTVEEPVYIDPSAIIEDGAHIGPYSVIGPLCRVSCGAGIKHSLLMGETAIASGAQLRGCICARGSAIGENAQLFEESVVGSRSRIGSYAVLSPGVKVWPEKSVPDGEHPADNVVWGSGKRQRFAADALMICDPGRAARCVQAILAEAEAGEALIGRQGSSAADALWHAAVSGAMAQGLQVMDAGICCLPQLRSALNNMHAGCALLVGDDYLLPLDANGCPLTEKRQRSVLKLLERQDYACPFSQATQPLIALGNTRSSYIADTAAAFAGDAALAPMIVLNAGDEMCGLMGEILVHTGIEFRCEAGEADLMPGELGVRFLNGGETAILRDEHGPLSEAQRQLACAWTARQLGENHLVLPLHFTRAIAQIDAGALYLPGERAVWLNALRQHSSLQFRLQLDGPYFLMCFLSKLAKNGLTLHSWRRSMPQVHRSSARLPVPERRSGQILHDLAREDGHAQLGGGVRLRSDRGWTWMHPEEGRLEIFAEAPSMEAADELCALYTGKIRRLLDGQD